MLIRFTALRPVLVIMVSWLMAASCVQAQSLGPDVAGGKDHPLISRFAGSQLVGHQQLAFETGRFFLPAADKKSDPAKEIDRDKPVSVEGQVTRLLYIMPPGKTALEVHRNFEQALKQAGVKLITSVDGREAWWEPGLHWRANFQDMKFGRPFASDILPFDRRGLYLYGTVTRGASEVSVSVLSGPVALFTRGVYKVPESTTLSAVAIQIVEAKAMATGQVMVSTDALKKGLEAEGRMALYGLYFDTGKSAIKPESVPQLEQMAQLLQQNPALKVHIVGHTDNAGALAANLALSQQRAQAVVDALITQHKIAAPRLSARGVANLSPVANNRDEGGRSKNRRVELVEQ